MGGVEVSYDESDYTPMRKFYAYIGFAVVWGGLLLLVLFALWGTRFVNSELAYARAEAAEVEPATEPAVSAVITAYSSTPDQTDDTPFITANGTRVRDGIVANNCLPFGTEVEINGRTYEVQDRMNRRYGCDRFDVWMESREAAVEWGVREHKVAVRI